MRDRAVCLDVAEQDLRDLDFRLGLELIELALRRGKLTERMPSEARSRSSPAPR